MVGCRDGVGGDAVTDAAPKPRSYWYDSTDKEVQRAVVSTVVREIRSEIWKAVLSEVKNPGLVDIWVNKEAMENAKEIVSGKILAAIS